MESERLNMSHNVCTKISEKINKIKSKTEEMNQKKKKEKAGQHWLVIDNTKEVFHCRTLCDYI